MLKFTFLALLTVHGLIHLIGFIKAFRLAEVNELSLDISKPMGLLWLAATLLFLITAIFFTTKNDSWWMVGTVAVICSQLLIIMHWQDAKFASIANALILIVLIITYGSWNFKRSTDVEVDKFISNINSTVPKLSPDSVPDLPLIVQKWLHYTNVFNSPVAPVACIRQKGLMRQQPENPWHSFTSRQWSSVTEPGFIWRAKMDAGMGMHVAIRDKYENGKGSMLVKLLSLYKIDDANGAAIDQGAMLRYLAELVWMPAGACMYYIRWESIDMLTASATIADHGKEATAIFTFNEKGQVISIDARRYFNKKEGATLEDWRVEFDPDGYRSFGGVLLPASTSLIWQLEEGDFEWYRSEVSDVLYQETFDQYHYPD